MKLSTQTTKKALALGMAAAMTTAVTLPAYATSTVTKSGETTATVSYSEEAYFTLSIPTTITLSSTSETTADIKLTALNMSDSNTIKVYANELYNKGDTLTLYGTNDTSKSVSADVTWTGECVGDENLMIIQSGDLDSLYIDGDDDDDYVATTMTFTAVEDADNDGYINPDTYTTTLTFVVSFT